MRQFIIALFLWSSSCFAQGSFHGCPDKGDNKSATIQALDTKKNRSDEPKSFQTVTFDAIIGHGEDSKLFSEDSGGTITAYVFNVAAGGVESCNCHATDELYRDTHITLTPDAKKTAGKYRMISEVTPRFRIKHPNWTTKKLKSLKGHFVRISGWILYDAEHRNAAENTHPKGAHNWRLSCIEVGHPVTKIEIIDGGKSEVVE